jgi:hypothetical protein
VDTQRDARVPLGAALAIQEAATLARRQQEEAAERAAVDRRRERAAEELETQRRSTQRDRISRVAARPREAAAIGAGVAGVARAACNAAGGAGGVETPSVSAGAGVRRARRRRGDLYGTRMYVEQACSGSWRIDG